MMVLPHLELFSVWTLCIVSCQQYKHYVSGIELFPVLRLKTRWMYTHLWVTDKGALVAHRLRKLYLLNLILKVNADVLS